MGKRLCESGKNCAAKNKKARAADFFEEKPCAARAFESRKGKTLARQNSMRAKRLKGEMAARWIHHFGWWPFDLSARAPLVVKEMVKEMVKEKPARQKQFAARLSSLLNAKRRGYNCC